MARNTHPSDASESIQHDGEPDGIRSKGEATEHHLSETGGFAPAGEDGDGDGAEQVCEFATTRGSGSDVHPSKQVLSLVQELTEEEDDEARVGRLEVKDGRAESAERECRDGHVRRHPQRARVDIPAIDASRSINA